MRRKITLISGIIVSVIITALLFATNYFYSEAVKRGEEVELHRGDEPVAVEAASMEDQSILQEAKSWYSEQEPVTVEQTSEDGLTLVADYLKNPDDSGKAVILAHGFRSQKEDMGDYVKFYYDQGFDVLMPDARGHGESEGAYIGYGWHDRLDYVNWIDILITNHEAEDIFLHGNSMGAATVLMTSGEELPGEVKGIIADSSYTTVMEELTHQLKHLYNLPAFPLLNFTSAMTKVRAGYSFTEASVIAQVGNNTRPLFMIHGAEDELVPTEMALELYEEAGGEKELWVVPEVGHTDGYEVATAEYEDRLEGFITEALND
ncbi:alpha/beta hydrolase [Lentibacillus sediminis]|uniref:alpha/beta hydrolase n=1 Tax=Lentibacillus sediminis TaxID=1940529 RepID=UPI000C1C0C45|nr:alpha/beta hydrolase [Lentibacillus sediminis]